MKSLIKKLIPAWLMAAYHKTLAVAANVYYGRPSEKLIVIGVTGTNGKTTVTSLIAKVLTEAGFKVGATSTAMFMIADKEWLNDQKMTMLGRFALQKMLRQMVDAGCRYAVIETSSQGVSQFRHLGIHYDALVFTNLTPEHIEAHGGFENYKQAKLELFRHLERGKIKMLDGKKVEKVIAVNGDDKYAREFLDFVVDKKYAFGVNDSGKEFSIFNFKFSNNFQGLNVRNINYKADGVSFELGNIIFDLKLFGEFNVYNSLAAIAIAQSQGVELETAKIALEKITTVPGRMEFINEGQNFKVLVDYAPEPESLKQLFETIKRHSLIPAGGRLIHVLGSCGGGRDVSRRPVLGQISASLAAIMVITNEDPYDDDPTKIINQVAQGGLSGGKVLRQDLFKIADRREAIRFALSQARENDLVLLTGKGSEQAICVAGGKKLKWDEREVAREELKKLTLK